MEKKSNITLLLVLSCIAVLLCPVLGIAPLVLSIITHGMIRQGEDSEKIARNVKWITWTLVAAFVIMVVITCVLFSSFTTVG